MYVLNGLNSSVEKLMGTVQFQVVDLWSVKCFLVHEIQNITINVNVKPIESSFLANANI